MRLLFLLFPFFCSAQNIYVSVSGSDSNQGTSSAPFKTIGKVNSVQADSVFFKAGDTFFGELIANRSNVFYGSYGTGAKPIITGFYLVPSWSQSGNIYSAVIPGQSTLNMVTVNGGFQPIGRWPKVTASNAGYLTFQSHSGFTSITSNAISGALNYVGGEVVVRGNHFDLNRGTITAQSSTTVTYSMIPGGPASPVLDNFGFFFQNHINACTSQNDWCYERVTKTIRIFSTVFPQNVNVLVLNNNVTISGKSNITFEGLSLQGSNSRSFNISSSSNIKINNCDISQAGQNGIYLINSSSITFSNGTMSHVMNNGIDGNGSTNLIIRKNVFSNIYFIAGMGSTGDGQGQVISYAGDGSLVEFNSFIDCGFNCAMFRGLNTWTCQNNFIKRFGFIKDDGGAIYAYKTDGPGKKLIQNNIVTDGIGAPFGTNGISGGGSIGIYLDGQSNNVSVLNNNVSNCQQIGILFNDPTNATISNNIVSGNGQNGQGGQIQINNNSAGLVVRGIINTKNTYEAKNSGQLLSLFYSVTDQDVHSFFLRCDSNTYISPTTDVIFKKEAASIHFTFPQWQSFIGKEVHSKFSLPVTYLSAAISGTFTRNNCISPATGGSITFSVPAGKYSSTISQTDANAKALADLNTNGQAAANVNGKCCYQ